jgi:citronellol/citronellal dehydrogenase
MRRSRKPDIVADAARAILTRPAAQCTGNFFIDDEVLAEEGVSDLGPYQYADAEPAVDLFLDG